jgi:ribosomal protein L44E
MTEQKCSECGSTALGEARWAGFGGTLQPAKKLDWKGGSKILVTVCTECGHISMKAEKPHIFK